MEYYKEKLNAKDSRLTEPSAGKQYERRKMLELSKKLGVRLLIKGRRI